jgi:phosphoenolpyruvate synthase/pyruvate phosphate dikinase
MATLVLNDISKITVPKFEICTLHDLDHNVNTWGNKAVVLNRLYAHGLKIPTTFVISSSAYVNYVKFNYSPDGLLQYLNLLNIEVQRWIDYLNLSTHDIIFRSSADIEGNSISCCGIFESYLSSDKDPFSDAVQSVWDSASTEIAKSYLGLHGIDINSINMAVIIQEYISGDICGVIQTWDVVKGKRRFIIEYDIARFEAVVGGDSNSIRINVDPEIPVTKSIGYVSKENLESLISVGLAVEEALGFHVEIEFTLKDNVVYIIQARKLL